jgi:hypothetical protein
MPNTEDTHIVHCAIAAPEWRRFRSVLASRGESIRASLEDWVRHVVAESDIAERADLTVCERLEPPAAESHVDGGGSPSAGTP